jgi:hypothetical protein
MMLGPRELLFDTSWLEEVEWREHGELRRRGHRPDFIVTTRTGRSMAIEVELNAKSPARLRAILGLYRGWLVSGRIDSLLYVAGSDRERRQVQGEAQTCGVELGERFGVQLLGQVAARLSNAAVDDATAAPTGGGER